MGDEMRDRIIEHFKMLTSIDSPSGREEELAEKLAGILDKLGFSVTQDKVGNIIAKRGDGEPLLLCCHMDTVESSAGLELKFDGDYITSSGDTILGADDKAGITVLLTVLDNLQSGPALEVVLSVQEETGMIGAKAIKPDSLQAKWGLVLDAGEPVGAIINQAPGESDFEITIYGRGAHAAANPEKGIDAIRLAARFIDLLPPPRIDQGSTFNIGIIKGGKSTNTICPRVVLKGEIRSYDNEKRTEIAQRLEKLLADTIRGTGGKFEFKSLESYSSYNVPENHELIELLQRTAAPVKIDVDIHPRFAGSDANILNGFDIAVVNMGVGVEDGHSHQERVSISAMENLAKWLEQVLKEWSNAKPQS